MPRTPSADAPRGCTFCRIAAHELAAPIVYEDSLLMAFLDHRPLFAGHSLLIPKRHLENLPALPADLIAPLFACAQRLAAAVELAMRAEGSFVAINNKVSQSVPHLHVHIVPRRKGDGLRGFFWPRGKYKDDAEIAATRGAIQSALAELERGREQP